MDQFRFLSCTDWLIGGMNVLFSQFQIYTTSIRLRSIHHSSIVIIMIFCCTSANSSKQRKTMKKKCQSPIDSSSLSSASYASISSASSTHKSDSGFSEGSSTRGLSTSMEQLLCSEKIHYQHLKESIIKYSRPLRRYLDPDEIVDLFQNIEKICTISESITRQCERSAHLNHLLIYQSWSTILIDSYCSYISRCRQARMTLEVCQEKIAYFLQIPREFIEEEISHFLLLPIQHICRLNQFFQSIHRDHSDFNAFIDEKFLRDLRLLAEQAQYHLQSSCIDQSSTTESSEDLTLLSEISSVMVLKRTNRQPWEPRRLELLNSRLIFTSLDRSIVTSSICLSNIVHIQEDPSQEELCFIVVASASNKMSKMYLRFEQGSNYPLWLNYLTNAIQYAKDQSWKDNNELII